VFTERALNPANLFDETVKPVARIGINALYLIPGGVGGTEIYLRELLDALARIDAGNQYFVFTNLDTGADLVPRQPNFHWKPQAVRATFRPARILWEQTILPLEAARHRLDALFNPGFTSPLLAHCPSITVFHDLQHKRHPEYFRRLDLPFWRLLLWMSAHTSRHLIATSEATRADLHRFYRTPRQSVTAIPHGVANRFFALDRSSTEPYLLYVATLHPHKNHERLLRAYAHRPRRERLVLAGIPGFHADTIKALIDELHLGDSVHLTGWIPREELYELYAHATACVIPSTFEGFGMPVLEALAAGIPTACSDIPPLRESAGDAALYFDPLDENAIAAALDRITEDQLLRRTLAESGPRQARLFTWERTARQTLDTLLSVCASH
jgi:glycosyltransferase involved in cell wall biosynthesis